MLEKGTNKAHKGFVFSDIHECKHYQEKYGGTIHRIQEEDEVEYFLDPEELSYGSHLDFGLDVPMTMIQTKTEKQINGNEVYVLSFTDRAKMMNSFGYIKRITFATS